MEQRLVAAVQRASRAEREATVAATEQLLTTMEKRLQKSVTAEVRSQFKSMQQSLEGKIKSEVREVLASEEPVVAAFRQSFQELIIPSFEAATQRMFDQINDAVVKGVAESAATGGANGAVRVRPAAAPAVPSLSPQEEISELLAENEYNEAMMKALGEKDLGLVTWLCQQLDTAILFGDGADEHPPLSQTVLVCLLQQLGAQLSTDTTLKLEWMKEISLNLDKDCEDIATYAPDVLKQLTVAMKSFASTPEGRLHSTELRLLMRVL